MPNQGYSPTTEAGRIVWLRNYYNKLPILGPLCGLDAATIAQTRAEIACLLWIYENWNPAMQQGALSATALKTQIASGSGNTIPALPALPPFDNPPPLCLPGVLPRLFHQIGGIKMHPGYTETIGHDMGIIGMSDSTIHPIPDLSASVEQGDGQQRVLLHYTKYQHAGAQIESRRGGGDWEVQGINITKPHIDDRPLLVPGTPEIREYRMRYWDKGQATGEFSPIATVTVGV